MSIKTPLRATAFALALLLTGCGNSPVNNYYLLSAHEFTAPSGETPALGVGPIEIPEYLKRERMIYNRAGNTLQVASVDLWSEPLDDGIQRVLLLNLAGLLNTQDVQSFPWHSKRAPQYGVKVNVLQLDAVSQKVQLTAEWLVYRPAGSEAVQRRVSQLQSSLPTDTNDAEQVAAAYSELFYQLSEIIAAAITADRAANAAVTP